MTTLDLRGAPMNINENVGARIVIAVTCVDSLTGNPVNVSGYTFDADILRAGTVLESFTPVVSGAGSNVVTFTLTSAQSAAIGTGGYGFAIKATVGDVVDYWYSGVCRLFNPDSSGGGSSPTAFTAVVGGTISAAVSVIGLPAAALAADPAFTSKYAPVADATDPTAIRLTAADYVTTPNNGAFTAPPALEIISRINLDDYSAAVQQTVVTVQAASNLMFSLTFATSGALQMLLSTNGSGWTQIGNVILDTVTSTWSGWKWVRVTWDSSTSRLVGYSADGSPQQIPTSWTEHSLQAGPSAALFASNAAMTIGKSGSSLVGKISRAIVRTSIGGTTVADWRATPATRYTDVAGRTWTMTGSTWSETSGKE